MRGRIRNLDSKVSFFAFADIITAVSGMLIFITLLLAIDLIQPTRGGNGQGQDPLLQKKLEDIQRQQSKIDEQNQQLGELLVEVESAPSDAKLSADVAELQQQINAEQQKIAALDRQITSATATNAAQDQQLGINGLKSKIEEIQRKTRAIAEQEAKAGQDADELKRLIAAENSRLLKLKALQGQSWVVPERGSQEPLLVTVAGKGIELDRFDHPEAHKDFPANTAESDFAGLLPTANSHTQYFVFMVRPSGIALFKRLSKIALQEGFEIGSDALEENEEIHFSTPPPDEPSQPLPRPSGDYASAPPGTAGGGQPDGQSGGHRGGAGTTVPSGHSSGGNAATGDPGSGSGGVGGGGGGGGGGERAGAGNGGSGVTQSNGTTPGGGNHNGSDGTGGANGNTPGRNHGGGTETATANSPGGGGSSGASGTAARGANGGGIGNSGNSNGTQSGQNGGSGTTGGSSGSPGQSQGGSAGSQSDQTQNGGSSQARQSGQATPNAPTAQPVSTPTGTNPEPKTSPREKGWWEKFLEWIGLN